MKERYKKIILNSIILFLAFSIGLLMSYNAKGYNVVKLSENVSLTDSDISYTYGYDISESDYIPINDDPQIGFQGLNADINVLLVKLTEPVQQDTFVQVYYALIGQSLSEQNSIRGYLYEGEKEFLAYLPEGIYGEIRIDINGSFSLEHITGSPDDIICEKTLEVTDVLHACVIMVALWILAYILRSKKKTICNKIKGIFSEYTKTKWFLLGTFITALFVWCFLFGYTLTTTSPLGKTWYEVLFIWTLVVLLCLFVFLGKDIAENKECIFAWICMLFSAYLAVTSPLGEVSWDDHIHYRRTVNLSNFLEDDINVAELKYTDPILEKVNDVNSTSLIKQNIAEKYENQVLIPQEEELSLYQELCYLPAAMFMFLGRAFLMPAHSLYYMGRLGMLSVYVLLVYQAMKRIKSGKMLLAVIALLPTNLFLCASYSYDPWVTGFSLLGVSIIISELQQPEKQMKWKDVAIMLGAFLMMGSAKAIYFPLLLLALFIGKNKFKNCKEYKLFICSVLAMMFVLILNYAIPVLSASDAVSDMRGGTDVNGMKQIEFILQNPLEYTEILFSFLKDYLSIEKSMEYTTFFAYLGYGTNLEVLWILVGIVAITDKNAYDLTSKRYRWGMFGIAFITIALVATALYVTFTPVGSMTINGCQPRYLMPILFPVLLVAGSNKIINNINKNIYTTVIYGVEMYVIVSCIWTTCISKYM